MEDVDYCRDPAQVAVYPDAAQALRGLKTHGFRLVVVTNQSGIGRGYFSEDDYQRVQTELDRQLGPGLLDAVYHCPDAPDHASERRKPGAGMIFGAVREHDLDLPHSYMIGDSNRDIESGRRAGLAAECPRPHRLKDREQLARGASRNFAAENFNRAAADWILRHAGLVSHG